MMEQTTPQHILISRTDNIGDLVLTIPMANHIKTHYPHSRITLLARQYTYDVAKAFKSIDNIITLDELQSLSDQQAVQILKDQQIDWFIHVSTNKYLAKLANKARIKHRVGTSHRWFHWLYCNHLLNFTRSHSSLHEAQLNFKLLAPLGINKIPNLDQLRPTPIHNLNRFETDKNDDPRFHVGIHPGSNFNGREWPEDNFIDLIHRLDPNKFIITITGSAKERQRFTKLSHLNENHIHHQMGTLSLQELTKFITTLDGYIAAGTGPMHLAAALGIPTLGLFPAHATAGPKRWQPIGPQAAYLVRPGSCPKSQHCNNDDCACMRDLTVDQVYRFIATWQTQSVIPTGKLAHG